MCLYSKLIANKKYTANQKNGGVIPAINDERVLWVAVGCGKCIECKKKKSRDWQIRIREDIKEHKNGVFVTLTFNQKSIIELSKEIDVKLQGYDRDNAIAKLATRRFLERWRKKYKKSIRHWLITELGHNGTERIHMHGILYTNNREDIEKIWKYGFVWVQNKGKTVNEKICNYITKYITKTDKKHKEYKSIILCSHGIGKRYIESINKKDNIYREKETNEAYSFTNGTKAALPIYYRNKIYNDDEREKLWINKLDENVRYILGEKIKIDKSLEKYFIKLGLARDKNKKLGYGDDRVNWDRIYYENQMRTILRKNITHTHVKDEEIPIRKTEEIIKLIKYENIKDIY